MYPETKSSGEGAKQGEGTTTVVKELPKLGAVGRPVSQSRLDGQARRTMVQLALYHLLALLLALLAYRACCHVPERDEKATTTNALGPLISKTTIDLSIYVDFTAVRRHENNNNSQILATFPAGFRQPTRVAV